ncbi:MAG: WYL domain-containing protein, partial [Paludibacteraceae bacterium]|nr:WYL domain-containing protein [Paludibacteraceae bacterium]
MTSGKLLKKYFWFLRAFQCGPISRAEISRRWLSSPLNDEKNPLARSSFYHMKNELEDLFSVSIAANKKGEFYIEQSFKEDEEFRKWLLNSLAVESSLEDYANMHGRIMYETIPGGVQYLQTVVDAMQNCYRLIIRYGSFSHEPREFIFAPYAVRIYKQRWYAIGESSDHPGEIRTYAFDR